MAWPVGLPMGSVNFGAAAVMQSGVQLPMKVTIDVVLATGAPAKVIVFRPTGSPLPGITTVFDTDTGTDTHTMPLPLCDSPNMGYGNGQAIVLDPTHQFTHVYRATIDYLSPDKAQTYTALRTIKTFAITTAAPTGDIDDMVLLPDGANNFGIPVYVPDIWTQQIADLTELVEGTVVAQDSAVAGLIEDPDSETATALNASIGEVTSSPLIASASAARFDSLGQVQLSARNKATSDRLLAAAEVLEDWADLASVTYSNVSVSSNKLRASINTAPQGAKIPITLGTEGCLFVTAITLGTAASFGAVGFAGPDTDIKASSTDAYIIGVNSSKQPAYSRGTAIGGTGQGAIDTGVTWAAGDVILITGAVLGGQVSLTVTHLASGATYTRTAGSMDQSAFTTGIGHILCYTGGTSGGTSHQIHPVVLIKAPADVDTIVAGFDTNAEGKHLNVNLGGDTRHLIIAPGNDPAVPAPLAVHLHNSGGTAINSVQDARITPFIAALLDAGFNIVMADASGSAWGNDTSRGQYIAAYEWASSLVATSSVVLTGQSMGGQVAFNLLPRREIPNVQAVLLVAPVTSLDDLYANNAGPYSANIRSAFGVASDGSDYESKTAGYRPEDRNGWEFRGVPVMIVTSPDDVTCHIAYAEDLIEKITPYVPEAVLIESTGAHMAAPQFADAVTHGIPFLQRYV